LSLRVGTEIKICLIHLANNSKYDCGRRTDNFKDRGQRSEQSSHSK